MLVLPSDFRKFLPLINKIGVAVSGGSDSMALLLLMVEAAREAGISVDAATVDHGLRPEASEECRFVSEACARLGVRHETLRWRDHTPGGNLQAKARDARYQLLSDWAKANDMAHVVLGHTSDDQAETVLMRMARGAGVDGLSGMAAQTSKHGVTFLRPLLQVRRATLRDWLNERGQTWVDDPSNEDLGFERVRARQALAVLEPLGLGPDAFETIGENMRQVRGALKRDLVDQAGKMVRQDGGDILIDRRAFIDLSVEHARRLIIAILRYVSGSDYAPRRAEQIKILQSVRQGKQATVSGCLISHKGDDVRIFREHNAVATLRCATDAVWDGKWRLEGAHNGGLEIGALGEAGLRSCADWRETGHPRASLIASPAVWKGERLIAAPIAGNSGGWTARIVTHFSDWLLSH